MSKKLEMRCSALALFGALGLAIHAGDASANLIPCEDTGVPSGPQASAVPSMVTDLGAVNFYEFRVCNLSDVANQVIIDWEMPFFGTALGNGNASRIDNIFVPEGWFWNIEEIGPGNPDTHWDGVAAWQTPDDPFYVFFNDFFGNQNGVEDAADDPANNPYNAVTHVLHFFTNVCFEGEEICGFNPIRPGGFLDGFGFTSPFGDTQAPYQASWELLPVRTGDPQFPIGAGPTNPIIDPTLLVPEPGSLAVLGAGLGALAAARRRRQAK